MTERPRYRRGIGAAGFSVSVGDAVDGLEGAGTVIQQDPGAGRVAGGTVVTAAGRYRPIPVDAGRRRRHRTVTGLEPRVD